MIERREVEQAYLTVCTNGHVANWKPVGKAWQVKHEYCGLWTWEDGKYCVNCGGKLDAPSGLAQSD
jgi:hypothetical protein